MLILISMMLVIWKLEGTASETPYHYINQVPVTTPHILTPKPLFSPHDARGEKVRYKNIQSYQSGIVRGNSNIPVNRYGEEHRIEQGNQGGHNVIYTDPSSILYGNQQIWYPVYTDMQYPGWLSVNKVPYELSYGSLPEGYAPQVPLRGDPTGYSFSYSAGDHNRHEMSDGRGNFFSSFSFVPPADGSGIQSNRIPSTLDYEMYSTSRPTVNIPTLIPGRSTVNIPASNPGRPTVTIPSLNPGPYSTVTPNHHSFDPSTPRPLIPSSPHSRPFDTPAARPLISYKPSNTDFTNGFYFSANNYPLNKIPPKPSLTVISHPLSTNIQYDNLAGQTSLRSSVSSTSLNKSHSDSVQVTTEGSYQALSRSLPLAFTSNKRITEITPRIVTQRNRVSPSPQGIYEFGSRISPTSRTAARRSTTELYTSRTNTQRTTRVFSTTTNKPSVVQKIPMKTRKQNDIDTDETDSRPKFIDDLTSLAYSSDKSISMNDTIIQIKPKRDKGFRIQYPDKNQINVIENDTSKALNSQERSSRTLELTNKDGHVTGNKTYLAGLGLRSNIHY